jgi:hypothetical protein
MEMQNILIFALIGAVCLFIVTGGFVSMTTDEEASSTQLGAGAAVGGALGAVMSYMSGGDTGPSMSSMLGLPSATSPEMKVGLPSF